MKKKKLSGITLIETILYLGITVFVLGALFSYGWNIVILNIKAQVARETGAAARLVGERLVYEIREAQSVDRSSSVFDGSPAKLGLQKDGETVTIEDSDNRVTIKRGSADPIPLHSGDIQIENLVFTEQISASDETEYVGFSFEAVAAYPGTQTRSEYQYSSDFRSGSSLRTSH